ncbi:MAG: phosphatidate cytidylyltransferase [Planctomycetota bacterium]
MLRWRLIGTVAIIGPLLLLLWLDDQRNYGHPGCWFGALLIAAALACSLELASLLKNKCASLRLPVVALAVTTSTLITFIPAVWPNNKPDCPMGDWGWLPLGLAAATAIILCDELRRFKPGEGATERITMSIFCVAYIAIPFGYMIRLRLTPPDRLGLMAFISVPFIVKFADAGAYFCGRFLGKNKMAPILSPKKTWEGGVGGIVTALISGLVYMYLIVPHLVTGTSPKFLGTVGVALAIAVTGMIGDLAISLFKRDVDQKDSANWLPGLGGCLDVLDSVLWAAPVAYVFWAAEWVV